MSVKIIKLLTGEELIAKVLPSSSDIVKLENPVRIVVIPPDPRMQFDPKKSANIGLAPWAEFTDDREFVLDKSHVLAIMNPIKEFATQYSSMFGGLVVPTTNLILPGS
jgi:hypothetical protein